MEFMSAWDNSNILKEKDRKFVNNMKSKIITKFQSTFNLLLRVLKRGLYKILMNKGGKVVEYYETRNLYKILVNMQVTFKGT